MKKLNFFVFLLSLVVIGFFSSCTSTKYGAHFQAGTYQSHALNKQGKVKEISLIQQEEKKAKVIADHVEAKDIKGEEAILVATTKEVKALAEAPKEEDLTLRKAKTGIEVKERLQNMTRKEKRELRRQVRKIRLANFIKNLPAYGHQEAEDMQQTTEVNILALILAILVPPLGVYVYEREITEKFWISLVLTILGYTSFLFIPALGLVPAVVYSVLVVLGVV